MTLKPAFVWNCPKCGQEWPSFAEEQPLSFTICPPCTYAWAASVARACREAGVEIGDVDTEILLDDTSKT